MSCADCHSALDRLAAGELPSAEFAALRAHAASCDACRREYERLSQVETHLERRALPQHRQQLLEGELFARLGIPQPGGATVIRPARWNPRRLAAIALPVAASIVLAVLLVPRVLSDSDDGFQPRSGVKEATFGVRAFCVAPDGQVTAEAGPEQTLRCALGSRVQFSHTGPEQTSLTIVGAGEEGGEPLIFFPLEGQPAAIPAGTDVPLSHSTPVTAEWLDRRVPVTATFRNAEGEVVGRTQLQLEPGQ